MSASRKNPIRRWTGPERKFDLIFEGTIAFLIVALLVVGATVIFGSADAGLTYPGGPPSPSGEAFSARYWVHSPLTDEEGAVDANGGTKDFLATVVAELDGSSDTAGYGPPYNETQDASQVLGAFSPTAIAHGLFGLTLPVNTAEDFVLAPLTNVVAPYDRTVAEAIRTYEAAGGSSSQGVAADAVVSEQQATWLSAYTDALDKATVCIGVITDTCLATTRDDQRDPTPRQSRAERRDRPGVRRLASRVMARSYRLIPLGRFAGAASAGIGRVRRRPDRGHGDPQPHARFVLRQGSDLRRRRSPGCG